MEFDTKSKNVLYVIIHYNNIQNIYDLLENIILYCFSYSSLSHKNFFKIIIFYEEYHSILFPQKNDDNHLILNLKYEDIRNLIYTKLEDFFKNCTELSNYSNIDSIPINKIFKKILLENNRASEIDILSNKNDENYFSRIMLCSDADSDNFYVDQKILFLLRRHNIVIDCISLSKSKNNGLQSIAYYTNGLYETISNILILLQTLLQIFLPNPEDRKNTKSSYILIKNENRIKCESCLNETEKPFMQYENKMIICDKCIFKKTH